MQTCPLVDPPAPVRVSAASTSDGEFIRPSNPSAPPLPPASLWDSAAGRLRVDVWTCPLVSVCMPACRLVRLLACGPAHRLGHPRPGSDRSIRPARSRAHPPTLSQCSNHVSDRPSSGQPESGLEDCVPTWRQADVSTCRHPRLAEELNGGGVANRPHSQNAFSSGDLMSISSRAQATKERSQQSVPPPAELKLWSLRSARSNAFWCWTEDLLTLPTCGLADVQTCRHVRLSTPWAWDFSPVAGGLGRRAGS